MCKSSRLGLQKITSNQSLFVSRQVSYRSGEYQAKSPFRNTSSKFLQVQDPARNCGTGREGQESLGSTRRRVYGLGSQ